MVLFGGADNRPARNEWAGAAGDRRGVGFGRLVLPAAAALAAGPGTSGSDKRSHLRRR